MNTQLFFTMLTAILAASLWIPYIIGVNNTQFEGQVNSFIRPPDPKAMKPWVHRAFRAHMNLLEQFMPFATIVIIGQLVGAQSVWLGYLAIAFFILRCAHAVGMISGYAQMPLRPLIFTSGFIITLAYAFIVLLSA